MKRNNIRPIIGMYSGLDEEFAHLLEMELISRFGRKDLGKGSLLNLTDGGEGNTGWICTPETRNKISQSRKGSVPWNLGIPHSENTRKKIQISNTGNIHSEETKQKRSKSLAGKPKSVEHNNNVSKSKTGLKRKPFSEEWKQKMSAAHRKRWAKIKENKGKENVT